MDCDDPSRPAREKMVGRQMYQAAITVRKRLSARVWS